MQRLSTTKSAAAQQQQQPSLERTIHFSQAQAIVWQIKFILNQINNKKAVTAASNELEILSKKFGKEFDKYLLKELIEQIDLKDSAKAQKDKNEPFKIQLLNQELVRCSVKPEFLLYFGEIAQATFNERYADFLAELTKRLRLSFPNQLLVALSIAESSKEESSTEGLKILKQKLIDYHNYGKPEPLPEYAVHRILSLISTNTDFVRQLFYFIFWQNQDDSLRDVAQYIKDSNAIKIGSHVALRSSLQQDLMFANVTQEEPSISLFRDGNGIDNLDKTYKMLEPWQLLIDLGHFSSYNYNYLLKALEDFKDINEKTMAKTLLHLSENHVGVEDLHSRIVYSTFEACKKGETSGLSKDPSNKTTQMGWSIDNLARAFRELYSNLNWSKVFESISEIEDDISLDSKSFLTFLQIFNKSKPQNVTYPLNMILNVEWENPQLQLNFIENSINFYIEKKEKSINFQRTDRRQDLIDEISGIKDKIPVEVLNVWTSVDLVERLIVLSDSHSFTKVRVLFDYPVKTIPEYLLLATALAKPTKGNLMIDEILSLLLPQFLGNHINSIPVLQALWKNNQPLMIRGICELCRHDQRVMNLSRVLDITQEVKDSLIPIVNCDDYYFAVNLGILAGKRDFLHYDVWLQGRINEVGTPFIKALIKYLKEHIILPVTEYIRKHTGANGSLDISPENLENQKQQVLERSHLSKEKLCITLEHLANLQNKRNQLIKEQTFDHIRDIVVKTGELYPNQVQQMQNSEEIDNAANDYFQKVFSAEPHQVDDKIVELIETMQKFKESDIKKEQEIYACMLHSLFDEYRFLHRYPQQYLEKIAKLFGAIIKYRIIDGTLQDIALKFAYEAFRREGKRQKFGVITIRQFFDMLPEFPQFFEEIYEIRSQIQQTDQQMIKDIEELYNKTMKNRSEEGKNAARNLHEDSKKHDEDKREEPKQNTKLADKKSEAQQVNQMHKIDQNEFLNTFQQNASGLKQNQQQNVLQATQSAPKTQGQQQKSVLQAQTSDLSLGRTTTPSSTQPFIPSYKFKNQEQQQQLQQTPSTLTSTEQSNLNVQSEAFRKKTPSIQPSQNAAAINQPIPTIPQIIVPQIQQMNILNAKNFVPTNIKSPAPIQQVSQATLQMQAQLDLKIQKAIQENARVRLEDIIEDSNMQGPPADAQEQIKFICNNTGKNNFAQKLEELKLLINASQPTQNLNWFIHYILTKRISQQTNNLHPLYIDMIKQLNPKDSIQMTLIQVVDLFKKCMILDEDVVIKISQRPANQMSPIKQYFINMGSFLGTMTVAQNRPILARELDLKQLLVEAFTSDKLKYVVTFVCRILKECKNSIFKASNPWIKANLEVLREINEWALQNNKGNMQNEILMEIDTMCRTLSLSSINEVNHTGFLKAAQTLQYTNPSQQIEVSHMQNKSSLIPAPPAQAQIQQPQVVNPQFPSFINRGQSISPIPGAFMNMQGANQAFLPQRFQTPTNDFSMMQQQQQQQQIQQQIIQQQDLQSRVVVSPEMLQIFSFLGAKKEVALRQVLGEAVDQSIVEILPPVVDRSVNIALITTRELVLKDFAYDGDFKKILKAADLIVQNLAGSLALVTCREPLKMSLTTNLKKFLTQLVQQSIQNISENDMILNEAQISDVAQTASRENLELGCKLIKKQVITKALAKVREDPQIIRAIEMRRQAQAQGVQMFQDESLISMFRDLPPQLQPNPNGLFDAQFQVYEDFSRLNKTTRRVDQQEISQQESSMSDIDQLLKKIESQQIIDEVMRVQLTIKFNQMNIDPQSQQTKDDTTKLWIFSQKVLQTICEKSNDNELITPLIEILSFIALNFKVEDLPKKLTHRFLECSEQVVINTELTILLMKNKILSIGEWDSQIANFVSESMKFQEQENIMQFMSSFLQEGVKIQKVFSFSQFPKVINVIEKISENPQIGKFFKPILDDLKNNQSLSKETLRAYFNDWAVTSFEENNPNQEKEINKFFHNLQAIGLYKDSEIMYNFCKVMVEVSIEKALLNNEGQKRPADRLDYRYIESFLKLMVVLLKTSDINKHEFMSKLFESIHEVLEQDHNQSKQEFNQKPYYRLLINILTAVNNSQFFNPKTHLLILFSLADLFSKLNPNKYPGFSFAWLELISHKQFMPHFLALQGNSLNIQYQNFVGNLKYQSVQPGTAGPQQNPLNRRQQNPGQQQPLPQQQQDNSFYQKWFKFKELIVSLFTFLKTNMILGQKLPLPLAKFYEATIRVVLVIRHDFPEFLCDFYFNFVNSLPEHCIQLRNIILSAHPRSIEWHDPFFKGLKVDNIKEVFQMPRMVINQSDSQFNPSSNPNSQSDQSAQGEHQVYLALMNLRQDLEGYFITKSPQLIQVICDKMMQSEEVVAGRRKINSNIINAVALFIGNHALLNKSQSFQQKDCYEMIKKIILNLNSETRQCLLNSLVNELRYINSFTYFYSWIVIYLFSDNDESIQEQITRILIERLQVHDPHPWGLCITFRELLQNPKYSFAKKSFVTQNMQVIEQLLQTRLQRFYPFWQNQRQNAQQVGQQPQNE